MNLLFIRNKNFNYQHKLIEEQLNNSRVLLITHKNLYKNQQHLIEASLNPQDRFIDDINRFIFQEASSMVLDLWDQTINEQQGQDVSSLVLSLLGSFINNIQEPRTLIIDCFDKFSASVQKRIVEIQKNSSRYRVKTLLVVDPEQWKFMDAIIMHTNMLYLAKLEGENSYVLSSLSNFELDQVKGLNPNEILVKRLNPNTSATIIKIDKEK